MLKGDLAAARLPEVLALLADGSASGCLHLSSPGDRTARVYLRSGRVYAVQAAPGDRPDLGTCLVSRGALGAEGLAEAVEAQQSELQGWRLGELLVHLGFVDQAVIDAFMAEHLREALTGLLNWTRGTWKLRLNERTRDDVAPPTPVTELLADVEARRRRWAAISPAVHGPEAVPLLSATGQSDTELQIHPDAWSLLCQVDGARTLAELARDCGLSVYEAGHVMFTLLEAGLLEVAAPAEHERSHPDADLDDEPAGGEAAGTGESWPVDLAARLTSALTSTPSRRTVPAQGSAPDAEELPADTPPPRHLERFADDEAVSGSIKRVSQALSAMLGPATSGDDMFSAPLHRPPRTPTAAPEDPRKAERHRREAHRRARDAEELASAQADLEAGRVAERERRDDLLPDGHVADVVDLQEVRRQAETAEAARLAALATLEAARLEEQARAEQQRLEAEAAAAAAAEQERLAAEAQAEAQAEAAELEQLAEQERIAELERIAERERLEAEARAEAAAAAEQERLADEAWLAAEAAEYARIAEQTRVQEQARLAAEAEAAEQARQEQARLAAEAEAAEQARQEQARLAAEAEAAALAENVAAATTIVSQDSWFPVEPDSPAAVEAADVLDRDPEPAWMSAETHAAALAELSAAASMDVAEPAKVGPTPVDVDASGGEFADTSFDATDSDEPMPSYGGYDTDTASLLRELSSLGLDDEPPPAPMSRPARTPPPRPSTIAAQKKRKGLFGRG